MSHMGSYLLPNGLEIAQLNKNETDFMYREIFIDLVYLQKEMDLPQDAVVFDVGANIGLFSLFVFAYYPSSRVYAFEPVPEVYNILKNNSEIFSWDIMLFNKALSNSVGKKEFTYYPYSTLQSGCYPNLSEDRNYLKATAMYSQKEKKLNASTYLLDKLISSKLQKESFVCSTTTVSQIIQECGLERIDLLKIDVERSELDIIRGVVSSDWSLINQVVAEVDSENTADHISDILTRNNFIVDIKEYKVLSDTPARILCARK